MLVLFITFLYIPRLLPIHGKSILQEIKIILNFFKAQHVYHPLALLMGKGWHTRTSGYLSQW